MGSIRGMGSSVVNDEMNALDTVQEWLLNGVGDLNLSRSQTSTNPSSKLSSSSASSRNVSIGSSCHPVHQSLPRNVPAVSMDDVDIEGWVQASYNDEMETFGDSKNGSWATIVLYISVELDGD